MLVTKCLRTSCAPLLPNISTTVLGCFDTAAAGVLLGKHWCWKRVQRAMTLHVPPAAAHDMNVQRFCR